MSSELAAAGFALASAAAWGVSDFSGGVGAKGMSAARVVLYAHAAGLICLLVLAFASREAVPPAPALLWGVMSGLGAAFAFVCFYQALAIGQMGINAPIAAVVTSALAVLFSLWQEGRPTSFQVAGFLLAIVAIWLMTMSSGKTAGLGLVVCGGIGFSIYLVCSKQSTGEAVYWPLALGRATSVLVLLAIVAAGRRSSQPTKMGYVLVAGVLDAVANALFVYATRYGRLDVATILSALYPVGTVLCARFILKERVSIRQSIGMVTALIAIPLISASSS